MTWRVFIFFTGCFMAKENQYSIVAREAYLNIVQKGMSFENAWNTATEKVITSKFGRDKGCPSFAINCFSNQQDTMIIMPNGINTQQRWVGGNFNKIEK